jgi:phosphohistidine phosphatase
MNVYLIRHAHAVDPDENPERPLSKRGREQVHALAAFLKRSELFQPAEFWHSPLVRSRETAELLAQGLRLRVPHTLIPELEPESDPHLAARRIKRAANAVAIVGHEPHLSALATLLVAGKTEPPVFVMKKCAALAIEGLGNHWSVRWHVSPDLLA